MAKLYPPQINGTIPAFYNDKEGATMMVVPFSMNRAVSMYEVKELKVKIKSLNGTLIGVVSSDYIDTTDMKAYFDVKPLVDFFTLGSYYKIQLAYVDKYSSEIGYYSTVGVIKYTVLPKVKIENLDLSKDNLSRESYFGVYEQEGDPTEKLYSSRFVIYDDDIIYYDTGDIIHNNTEDEYREKSGESVKIPIELEIDKRYYIQFSIKTTNGVEAKTARYKIVQRRSVDPSITAELKAALDYNNGYIILTLKDTVDSVISGSFVVSRCDNVHGWQWQKIRSFTMSSTSPDRFYFKDCTIEQGVVYRYSIQQYNENNGIYSNRIISNLVEADFEDAFLYDGERQLRIRFNPKITSFKTDLQESKSETIGYQYPFFTRNSHIYYKEFPISGLISYLMDDNEMFIKKEELGIDLITVDSTMRNSQFINWHRNRKETRYNTTTDLTARNIAAERFFKMNVLQWLNNGKPKSFRSPGEGNYLVRLMNISLSPNDATGRMLHTFSCQAYEIGEYTLENLAYYGIYDPINTTGQERHWSTINIREYIDKYFKENGLSYSDPENIPEWIPLVDDRKIPEIFVVDVVPGGKIRIDKEEIIIGSTGSYRAENELDPFTLIELNPMSINEGLITYGFDAKVQDSFSNIEEVVIEEVPCRQLIGTSYYKIGENNIETNIFDVLQDIRSSILQVNYLKVSKRPIIDGFINSADDYETIISYLGDISLRPNLITMNAFSEYDENSTNNSKTITIFKFDEEFGPQDVSNQGLYELPLYQLRVKRQDRREMETAGELINEAGPKSFVYKDLIPYTFEQYYIDKHMDRFCPYTGYFFDPLTGNIFKADENLFHFTIDNEDIDVTEIETWEIKNLSTTIKSIILNNGVYAELSYSKQHSIYKFESDKDSSVRDESLYEVRTIYENNLAMYLIAREGNVTKDTITSSLLDYIKSYLPIAYKNIDKTSEIQWNATYKPHLINPYSGTSQTPANPIYYYGNNVNNAQVEGLNKLKKMVEESYDEYLNQLRQAIENYDREHGIL